MLNQTLLALTTAFVARAPFSMALSHQKRNLHVQSCIFNNYINSAFKFNHQLSEVVFRKSTFRNFLAHPIDLQSGTTYKFIDQYVFLRIDLTFQLPETCLVDSCMFVMCYGAKTENGGALSIVSESGFGFGTVSVQYCSFLSCKTNNGEGGAIYTWVQSNSIIGSCFLYCHTESNEIVVERNAGQAVFLSCGMTDLASTASFIMRADSFTACPENPIELTNTPIYVSFGNQDLDDSNITSNHVAEGVSGYHSDLSKAFSMRFLNFNNNTGGALISLGDIEYGDQIQYINVVNNKISVAPNTLFYVEVNDTAGMLVDHTVFVKDPATKISAFKGKKPTQKITLTNCIFASLDQSDFTLNSAENCTIDYASSDKNNKFQMNPETYTVSIFNSEECWYIEPPKYPAGAASNFFYIFFIIFIAVISAGIFLQIRFFRTGVAPSTMPSDPIIAASKGSYEAIE